MRIRTYEVLHQACVLCQFLVSRNSPNCMHMNFLFAGNSVLNISPCPHFKSDKAELYIGLEVCMYLTISATSYPFTHSHYTHTRTHVTPSAILYVLYIPSLQYDQWMCQVEKMVYQFCKCHAPSVGGGGGPPHPHSASDTAGSKGWLSGLLGQTTWMHSAQQGVPYVSEEWSNFVLYINWITLNVCVSSWCNHGVRIKNLCRIISHVYIIHIQ